MGFFKGSTCSKGSTSLKEWASLKEQDALKEGPSFMTFSKGRHKY